MKEDILPEKDKRFVAEHLERAKMLYKDYLSLGTLEKVAKKHGRTKERVRQILKEGDSKGLFKYPPESPISSITPEKIRKDYLKYGSREALAKHYEVRIGTLDQAIRKYHLSLKELRLERGKNRVLEDYKKTVKEIGPRHPTTTELQRSIRGGISLCNRIVFHYGSIDNFRKTYSYPIPKKGNPNFTKKIIQIYQTNRENILKCVKIKPGITMREIVDTLGIPVESVRLHLIRLKNEGIVDYRKDGRFHYYFLKHPEKLAEDNKHLKLSDLKPLMNPEDKLFISELTRLYLEYGDLNIVSRKMKKDKASLLDEIDRILKAGYLLPIKNRRTLFLSLRIKRDYDKIGRADLTAKQYGLSGATASRYLIYGNKAGLFKYDGYARKRKQKIRFVPKREDAYSKRNIKTMFNIKKEYDSLGSLHKTAKKIGLSRERIRQILVMGNDIGLFEFPPRKERLYSRITKEKLQEDFLRYKSLSRLRRHYKVSMEEAKEAIKKHNISMATIKVEVSRIKALKTYQDIVKELGHHPTTTEIKKRHGYLLRRIKKIWGSIYNFRKSYGFPDSRDGLK